MSIQSARDFIEWVEREKVPEPWKLEGWKGAIRWFFRTGRSVEREASQADEDAPVWIDSTDRPGWERCMVQEIRKRRYSYRTEKAYVSWVRRFARFVGTDDLDGLGESDLKRFLDRLAMDRISAASQRQALNALVFYYREVLRRELGDFSDYLRAKARKPLPVWLTRAEMHAVLTELSDGSRLMAQLMFGGGLRLTELLRLRVKDLDLEQEIYPHVLRKPGVGVKSPLDL